MTGAAAAASANKIAKSSASLGCHGTARFRRVRRRRVPAAPRLRSGVPGAEPVPAMALAGRRDAPEPPDFGILKRLARDQLVYLLEQVRGPPGAGIPHRGGRGESAGSALALGLRVGSRGRGGGGSARGSRGVPAHARLPAAPREEGPVHRGRPDEPPGPHRQRVHPEGTAGSARAGPARRRPRPPRACPRSSTTWTSCTRWRRGRAPAPATSECCGQGCGQGWLPVRGPWREGSVSSPGHEQHRARAAPRSLCDAGSVSWCGRGSGPCGSSRVSAAPARLPALCPGPRGSRRAPLPGSRCAWGDRALAGWAALQGLCGLSTDIVNADKMSGRSRKYKIIFSPQKVSGTLGTAHSPATLCLPSLCFHPVYRHQKSFISNPEMFKLTQVL